MSEETKVTFTPEQQALVDKLVGDARVKAREKTTTELEAQATKDKSTAEQASLAAGQEWQKLAERHQARVTELEPLEKQIGKYEDVIKGMLKTAIQEKGDAAKTAVGALPDGMSALDKLAWLNKNTGLFQAASGGVGTPKRPVISQQVKKAEPQRVTSL